MTKVGLRMVEELRGDSRLTLEEIANPKKGICSSRSFGRAVTNYKELAEAVATYTNRVGEKLRDEKLIARHIRVYIRTNKYNNDRKFYAGEGYDLPVATSFTPELTKATARILERLYEPGYRYWKAAVEVHELMPENVIQQSMFESLDNERHQRIMKIYDKVNDRYGERAIQTLSMGVKINWGMKREMLSPSYTTKWADIPEVSV